MTRGVSVTTGQRADLCARYKAGASQAQLARWSGLHRVTVGRLLVDGGVVLRPHRQRGKPWGTPALSAEERVEMAARYRAGESIRTLAAAYGLPYTTAHTNLAREGVVFRSRGGAR